MQQAFRDICIAGSYLELEVEDAACQNWSVVSSLPFQKSVNYLFPVAIAGKCNKVRRFSVIPTEHSKLFPNPLSFVSDAATEVCWKAAGPQNVLV